MFFVVLLLQKFIRFNEFQAVECGYDEYRRFRTLNREISRYGMLNSLAKSGGFILDVLEEIDSHQ